MNKTRISYRLSIYILSTTIVVISAIVLLNYRYTKRMLMQRIEESVINQSELIINRVARQIVSAQEITRNVANQSLYYLKHNDLEFFLKNVLEANQILNGIHIDLKPEFSNGRFQSRYTAYKELDSVLCSDSGNKCIFEQYPDFYKQLERSLNGFWTEPYICKRDNKQLVISFSFPVILPGTDQIVGNASGEIAMEYINQVVSGIKIGKEGVSFIINKSGLFLTHPVNEWIMKRNLFELPEKILPPNISELKRMVENGQHGSGYGFPEMYNSRKAWFYFAPMPYTNWTVIILIPEKQMFNDLWVVFRQIITVSLIGILLIFAIFIIIFRRTLNPLMQITRDIQSFSFEGKKEDSVKNEIVALVESLEVLQTRYGQFQQEQNQTKKDKRRFDKEMKSAKEIQFNIIPSGYPAFPDRDEFDLYAVLNPAQIIGGDLYDYFFIDKDHLLFTIGDVSGKGIPASLFMAVAHTLIKGNASVLSSKHIVEMLNKKLSHRNTNQHFLTIFLGILDVQNGILDYCNAAHNYPYILRNNGEIETLDQTHGLPVGIYPGKSYNSSSTVLKPGDTILLFTDGVIDCRDENDNTYGQQRLEENLQNLQNLTCIKMITKIENSLNLFKGNSLQADDISLMTLQYKGKKV